MSTTSRRSWQAIIVLVGISTAGPTGAAAQQRDRDDPLARMEYFYRQRAYPFASVRPNALETARAAYAARWPGAIGARRVQSAATVGGWAARGPSPIIDLVEHPGTRAAGRVTAIAVDPSNFATIYAGAADGGVWRSVDGGANWTPLTDGECSLSIGSVALDPVAHSIVYAGTGEATQGGDAYFGCGVLRSTDRGATWIRLAPFDNNPLTVISKILIDAGTAGSATSSTIFAATTCRGLFRSTNSGATWTGVLQGCVTDLVQDPSTPSTLYAAVRDVGVYKSTDGGVNWLLLSGGLPSLNVGRIQLAIAASQPATLYAAVNLGGVLGAFKTVNAGASWSHLAAAGASCTLCYYALAIAVDPTNPDLVYVGGDSVYRSADGGASFTHISGGIHVDQHVLVIDAQNPAAILVGNDGGIYSSADYGSSWTDLNSTLSITQFYPGLSAFRGSSREMLLGGTQDNGTVEYDGSSVWPRVLFADGGFTAVNYQTPTTAFAECQWKCGPYRRDATTRGAFVPKSFGINFGDPALFLPPLVMDPVDPQVLYFGTNRLYRTTDNAESWVAISPAFSGRISAIAVAPSATQNVYVGTSDGTVQLTPNGFSWIPIAAGLPKRYVTHVAVDPADAAHVYVTVSGFGTGHVFETVNMGTSWQDISSHLVDVPVNALFRHPGTGALYIGTDLGVFVSTDDGGSWSPSAMGLPNAAVTDLAFNSTTQTLYAGTHGRGVFAYNLGPGILRGDVTLDGQVTTIDAQAILFGVAGSPLPSGSVFYPNGDANCDGRTGAVDAQIVLSLVVGLPTAQFCVGGVR